MRIRSRKKPRGHDPKTLSISDLFLGTYPGKSRFAEAYRTLRTNTHFALMEKDFRCLLITSSTAKEGKSISTMNLSYTMSQAGKSVLMIDADLRKPSLSRQFHSVGSCGLTGLLTDVLGTEITSGSLNKLGVSDLFRMLSLQKKTGLLHFSCGKEEIDLMFLHGKMVDLNWLTRPSEKKLASLLIKNNLLTKEQIKDALVRQKSIGQKLGFVLINMGLLKKEDLTGPITIHMMEGLRAVLQFKAGEFFFKALPESDFEQASFDPVDFDQLYNQVIIGEEELPYLQKEINAAIVDTASPNLFLLPSGRLPPSPPEILDTDRTSFLISNLKKRFDVIVIDTPPILPASDALILAPHTDGVLLIVKAGMVNREMVKKVVEQLRLTQANLLGVVLNDVDTKREGYYKYYHKYYSKYYGEDS